MLTGQQLVMSRYPLAVKVRTLSNSPSNVCIVNPRLRRVFSVLHISRGLTLRHLFCFISVWLLMYLTFLPILFLCVYDFDYGGVFFLLVTGEASFCNFFSPSVQSKIRPQYGLQSHILIMYYAIYYVLCNKLSSSGVFLIIKEK